MKRNELRIEAMLDIFSGRPNPKWILFREQVEELRAKLGKFPAAQPKMPPGLGYRGVMITNLNKSPGFPERILAYHGIVSIMDKGITIYQEDVNHIEGWILDQACERGHGEVIRQLRQYGASDIKTDVRISFT